MNILARIEASTEELTRSSKICTPILKSGWKNSRHAGDRGRQAASYGVGRGPYRHRYHRVVAFIYGRGGKDAGGKWNRVVGLRADMDARRFYAADKPAHILRPMLAKSIACGHDKPTRTMLAGPAKPPCRNTRFRRHGVHDLAKKKKNPPGPEGGGKTSGPVGRAACWPDGLFDRFPCTEVFGMHNSPKWPGRHRGIWQRPPPWAGAAFFDITINRQAAIAAMPQQIARYAAWWHRAPLSGKLQTIAQPQCSALGYLRAVSGPRSTRALPTTSSPKQHS